MNELLTKIDRAHKKLEQLAVAAAEVKKSVESAGDALRLVQDKKFAKRLSSGVDHGAEAWRRARRDGGLVGAALHLVADQSVHAELRSSGKDFTQAYERIDAKRRGHRVVTSFAKLGAAAGLGSLAATPKVRERVSELISSVAKNSRPLKDAAAEKVTRSNGSRPHALEDLTKEKLYARAQEAGIPGRSEMSKEELIDALRVKA